MAPYQMSVTSQAKFKPLARRRTLAGRIEKQEKPGAQQVKKKPLAFLKTLAFRPKKDPSENAPTDQVKQDSFKKALADRVDEESLVTNTQTPAAANTVCLAENKDRPFRLHDAIPRSGLRFPGEKEGNRPIIGKWKAENKGVVSPVFHQAAEMIEGGYLQGLTRHEDITEEGGSDIWKRFLGKLWVDSIKKWAAQVVPAPVHQPKNDGEPPGLLVRHISMFLEAAERAGSPWAKGGDVFSDDDDEEREYRLAGFFVDALGQF
ncbi:hypothetical protein INS49_002873 [Diaporthe citri]|uniref:uncharacterized protein n=1 Tax=Diaporthe citri TaxID=83186 RepID=UPI001C81B331|nr:uncharacterized protein INS49_002873 [Diaporthe citri]KAG6368660.1 hypothetical protein INS49_002873 [Diaporthe citri]